MGGKGGKGQKGLLRARVAWDMANLPPESPEKKAEREAKLAELQASYPAETQPGSGSTGDATQSEEPKSLHRQPRAFPSFRAADPYATRHRRGGLRNIDL